VNTFVQLLQQEVVSTIEGLTGIAPTVELNAEESGESKLTLSPPLAKLDITVGGELHGNHGNIHRYCHWRHDVGW
jgi:flagellar motor switch protein FliN/FliY